MNKVKNIFRLLIVVFVALCIYFFSRAKLGYRGMEIKENLNGRQAVLITYDEDSNTIDTVKGNSISIKPERKFNETDNEGNITKKSRVLNITVGGKEMIHVGSSLINRDEGLEDVFKKYSDKVKVSNEDRSVPFINRLKNECKNDMTGKSKIILIRSQSGKPLATFLGNSVSYFSTDIPTSTGLVVDGKKLFIYRCDYTIYDMGLLGNN